MQHAPTTPRRAVPRRLLALTSLEEIVVDSFAGGGGASLGIEMALGYSPHVAVNHDWEAIAMHKANHPTSEHFGRNVWRLDPREVCRGRPVGLMWLSPDCKHFSKAKGGKPVSKKIRGLAWVAVRWAEAVRPRVIVLENVEEFRTWGPLLTGTDRPCPRRKGQTFREFVRRLERLGYAVEHRELRACDYGSPTTRKRLFLIARCDGEPIVWPTPTHGAERALPWRTAAECIDFDLPCPSIFLTKAEAKALGFPRIQRPLKPPTQRRIARGLFRFVIDAPDPFIVPMYHDNAPESVREPLSTITTQRNKHVLVTPFLNVYRGTKVEGQERVHRVTEPLRTQDTGPRYGLVAPSLVRVAHGERDAKGKKRGRGEHSVTEPIGTITGQNEFAVMAPTLIQTGYGEREGQAPRSLDIQQPIGVIVPDGKHALVSSFLAKHYGDTGQRPGSKMREPVDAITANDHHALISSHLLKLHGSSRLGQAVVDPVPTIRAGGNHLAEVRAFLIAYYGTDQKTGNLKTPMATVTGTDRFGLVTVHGQDYVIVDIGMRMLSVRERFRAQGFPDSYVIDVPFDYRVKRRRKKGMITITVRKPLTQEAQGRMVGNSVNPDLAKAIVRDNCGWLVRRKERSA